MIHVPSNVSAVASSVGGLAAAALQATVGRRPSIPNDAAWSAAPTYVDEEWGASGELRCVFFGVTTVALTDGETTLMFDGFFSRPHLVNVLLGKIEPNHSVIDAALERTGITDIDAVLVAHSHYDHALDAPAVAWRTGAKLVGSESTLNIGRGFGLADDSLKLIESAEPIEFGRFSVTPVLSEHSPKPKFTGFIEHPLKAPARTRDYRMAECYAYVVTHRTEGKEPQRLLMHASAGFAPNCLAGERADVAFLGVAPIGKQPDSFRQEYWEQTVATVGARRVFITHWDDFSLPLSEPLVPLPYLADNFEATVEFLDHKREADGTEILIPQPFELMDPFAELG